MTCPVFVNDSASSRFNDLLIQFQFGFVAAGISGRSSDHTAARHAYVDRILIMEETGIEGDRSIRPWIGERCNDLIKISFDPADLGEAMLIDLDVECEIEDD